MIGRYRCAINTLVQTIYIRKLFLIDALINALIPIRLVAQLEYLVVEVACERLHPLEVK